MKSVILSNASRIMLPLLLLFSLYLLVRGHDQPGSGFTGGLVAASAFVLIAFAEGIDKAEKTLKFNPSTIIAVGLLFSLLSGCISFVFNEPFMTSYWLEFDFLYPLKIGTPLIFDSGVYLVVVGVTLKIIFTLFGDLK